VTDSIKDIDGDDPLPKREAAIRQIASSNGVAGSLRLVVIAEQALCFLEYLRLASRVELPELDRSVRRPPLSETRAEVKRQAISAKDGVVDASKALSRATTRVAKQVSEAVREKTAGLFD
jgi:hypothetical protein